MFLLVPCFIVMAALSEQLVAIKIIFLLRKNQAETVVMLKTASKDNVLDKTHVYKWFSHFKHGEMTIDD